MRTRNYLAGAVALLFLMSPSVSSASTASDIQAQINALLAQLASLQSSTSGASGNQLTYAVSSSNPLMVTFTYTMNQKKSCGGGTYNLRFGDGTMESLQFPADACNSYVQHTEHTYYTAATFEAALTAKDSTGETNLQKVNVNLRSPSNAHVEIMSPNGGESYAAGSGKKVTVYWRASGIPKGATARTAFTNIADSHDFTFPGDNSCTKVKNGMNKCTGTLIRTSGYDLGPGEYRAQVWVYGARNSSGKDSEEIAFDESDKAFTLTGQTSSGPSVEFLSASMNEVKARYANADSKSEIEVVNDSTGVVISTYDIRFGGSDTVTIHVNTEEVALGTYHLELASGDKPWPKSQSFKLVGTAPVCKVSVSQSGGMTTLTWKSTGATSATSDLYYGKTGTYDPIAVNGSLTFGNPNAPTTYSFWFVGPGGRSTCVSQIVNPSAASVTFDYNSFATENPTLSGSAKGTTLFGITVDNGDKIYGSGKTIVPVNGKWSHKVSEDLKDGSYHVIAYDAQNEKLGSASISVQSTGTSGDTLSATPVSGTAPLQVLFNGVTNVKKSCGGGLATLDFGDGSTPYQIMFPADLCKAKSWSVLHTYSAGVYTAKLYNGSLVKGTPLAGTTITAVASTVPKSTPTPSPTYLKNFEDTGGLEAASAYLAIQSALEAILAQLKDLAR